MRKVLEYKKYILLSFYSLVCMYLAMYFVLSFLNFITAFDNLDYLTNNFVLMLYLVVNQVLIGLFFANWYIKKRPQLNLLALILILINVYF